MINSYPLHIELQFEKVYRNAVKKLARLVLPKIKQQYKLDQVKQFDAENLQETENESYRLLELIFASGLIERGIRESAILLDRWALAKTNQAIRRLKMVTSKNARQFIPVEINKVNPFVDDFINEYTKFNMGIVEELGKEYIPEVSQLAQKAFIDGESTASLAQKLKIFTEGKITKAEFWAQDQAGDAYSAFTKIRQSQAGFPGYIWRTTGDNKVRPLHALLNQRYFTWAKGSPGLTKPGAKHPAQDYRCRCSAEPADGDEGIIREDKTIVPIKQKSKIQVI